MAGLEDILGMASTGQLDDGGVAGGIADAIDLGGDIVSEVASGDPTARQKGQISRVQRYMDKGYALIKTKDGYTFDNGKGQLIETINEDDLDAVMGSVMGDDYDGEALRTAVTEGGKGGASFSSNGGGGFSLSGRSGGSPSGPGQESATPTPTTASPTTATTQQPQAQPAPEIPGIPQQPPMGGETGGPLEVGNITDPGRRGETSDGVPASIYDFLPSPEDLKNMTPEERMSAIIGATTRRQEHGLETGLGRLDQARGQHDERAQGVRNLEDRILGDTDVMDEGTIQRISGKTTEHANQGAALLSQALGNRRAGAGSSRSGSAQTEQSAIMQNALGTAINAESDVRAGAREKNFASRNAALSAAGQSQRADAGVNAGLQGQAAGAIHDSQVFGDAFLTQNLLNRGAANNQQPVFRTVEAGGGGVQERLQ